MQRSFDENRGLNLVALGGGTGLSTLLAGLKRLVGERQSDWLRNLAAIVTVSDDGGVLDGYEKSCKCYRRATFAIA